MTKLINNQIMKRLKNKRISQNITIKEMAIYLQNVTGINVSEKTIYGWEEGASMPNIVMFCAICEYLNVTDILYLTSSDETILQKKLFAEKLFTAYEKHPSLQYAINILLEIV